MRHWISTNRQSVSLNINSVLNENPTHPSYSSINLPLLPLWCRIHSCDDDDDAQCIHRQQKQRVKQNESVNSEQRESRQHNQTKRRHKIVTFSGPYAIAKMCCTFVRFIRLLCSLSPSFLFPTRLVLLVASCLLQKRSKEREMPKKNMFYDDNTVAGRIYAEKSKKPNVCDRNKNEGKTSREVFAS